MGWKSGKQVGLEEGHGYLWLMTDNTLVELCVHAFDMVARLLCWQVPQDWVWVWEHLQLPMETLSEFLYHSATMSMHQAT